MSTLLLSPMAATVVLHALAQAAQTVPVPGAEARSTAQTPRRADDEDALRAAAGDAETFTLRLDTDPDRIALLFRAQTVLLVPDDAPLTHVPTSAALFRARAVSATAPRAPPFS